MLNTRIAETWGFLQADADGELTDKMIVEQLEAIARQARAGFIEGDGFPVFVPMEDYLRQKARRS